jgi:hypothetical protein
MTLKQLIGRYTWLNIEAALLQEYPARQAYLHQYESVYQTLLLLPEAATDLMICIEKVPGAHNEENGTIKVYGKRKTPHIAEAQLSLPYALHFTAWGEWLAMPVSLKCLHRFSETEIIAHCLCEMTRNGFDESTIQVAAHNLSAILDRMNTTNHHSPEIISFDEFLKQLIEKQR